MLSLLRNSKIFLLTLILFPQGAIIILAFQETAADFYISRGEESELSGTIFLRNGDPAVSATVHLYPVPGELANQPPLMTREDARVSTIADENGHFSLKVPSDGVYVLHAHTDGYMTSHVYDRQKENHSPWLIRETVPSSPITMTLSPVETHHVRILTPAELDKRMILYHADSVPIGRHQHDAEQLIVIPEGTKEWVNARTFGTPHQVFFEPEKKKVAAYSKSVSIEGRVVDTTGTPVKNLVLSLAWHVQKDLQSKLNTRRVITNAKGFFQIHALDVSVQRGDYLELSTEDPRFRTMRPILISTSRKDPVVLEIELVPKQGRTLRVNVTDTNGQPINGVRISPRPFFQNSPTSADVFVAHQIKTVTVEANGHESQIVPVDGGDISVSLVASPTRSDGLVSSQVIAADGRGLPSVTIQGPTGITAVTDQQGRFGIAGLRKEDRLKFSKPGYQALTTKVSDGEPITLKPVKKLKIEVVDSQTGDAISSVLALDLLISGTRSSVHLERDILESKDEHFSRRSGKFSIDLPDPEKSYRYVVIRADGYEQQIFRSRSISSQPLVVALTPSKFARQTIAGRIIDDTGKPLVGASIAIKEYEAGFPGNLNWQFDPVRSEVIMGSSSSEAPTVPVVQSEANGKYVTPAVLSDRYKIAAIGSPGYPTRMVILPPGPPGQPESLDITLPRSWTFKFQVNRTDYPYDFHLSVDYKSKVAETDSTYFVENRQWKQVFQGPTLPADQASVTWDSLAPGKATVSIFTRDAKGGLHGPIVSLPVNPAPGDSIAYTLGHGNGVSIGGKAFRNGKPLVGQNIAAVSESIVLKMVRTDNNGNFLLEDLPPQFYRLIPLSEGEVARFPKLKISNRKRGIGVELTQDSKFTNLQWAFD